MRITVPVVFVRRTSVYQFYAFALYRLAQRSAAYGLALQGMQFAFGIYVLSSQDSSLPLPPFQFAPACTRLTNGLQRKLNKFKVPLSPFGAHTRLGHSRAVVRRTTSLYCKQWYKILSSKI